MKLLMQVFIGVFVLFLAPAATLAQTATPPRSPSTPPAINPIEMLENASEVVPGLDGQLSSTLNILVLLTVLALAPSILLLCTCFTRIIIVLGLLRQALGTQGLPPTQVLLGLSLFITFVVMAPTLEAMYANGIKPYADGEVTSYEEAWQRTKQPLRDYMFGQIEATGNWSGVYMMLNYRGVDTSDPGELDRSDVDMVTLIPAFILSELKVAFLIGFRVFLPFLVIDLVIASMLVSMGMLMLPPVLISLPFKILLFVLVDGWSLLVGSLMTGVYQPETLQHVIGGLSGAGP
ncbi:MAG: flagellar type III secretion system pore protein FliP [Phycisphaerales bacterium]|nr:flagellar type III secretion system pore protein FliP [Phycisphaerales bacterium]|tara:strand:- start:2585 stop:3457 length:873 start_codon:yes stop_codon:yes gene_type:complete